VSKELVGKKKAKSPRMKSVMPRVRKSKTDSLYGLTRVDEQDGENARKGWNVIVCKIIDGKQKHVFPSKFFADDPNESELIGKMNSREMAIEYRDSNMLMTGMSKLKMPEITHRVRKGEVTALKNKSRSDPEMYGISRDPRTKTPSLAGWRVRVKKDSKHFSDKGNGGKEQALAEAKKYRDELLGGSVPQEKVQVSQGKIRAARIKAGISQDLASKWMDVSKLTFGKLERAGDENVNPAFVDLFCRYASKKLDPEAEIGTFDLKSVRAELGKTQAEMSNLVSGSNSQNPWASWETGKTKVPGWLWKYIGLIGFQKGKDLRKNDKKLGS
jgi:DNA-binding XRE family transcriptional regulator